jgi:hypothetical protein
MGGRIAYEKKGTQVSSSPPFVPFSLFSPFSRYKSLQPCCVARYDGKKKTDPEEPYITPPTSLQIILLKRHMKSLKNPWFVYKIIIFESPRGFGNSKFGCSRIQNLKDSRDYERL